MAGDFGSTAGILVIYEEDAEEWAMYLKSVFQHIILEDRILLRNLESASIHHMELQYLCTYRCKLLILSSGLLNYLNQKKRHFLDKILQPPENVVILLCGVENSDILYGILNVDQSNQVITTDQDPEVYLEVIAGIIQQGSHDMLPLDLENGLKLEDASVATELIPEMLERAAVLVLPTRISCENPEEIFILLGDEIPDDSVEIEFIAENQCIRTQPDVWNQKVRCMKALDFPAGFVNVNIYCEGVIKATTQIEYYTTAGEMECMLEKVADPIAFVCQASKYSSAEKVDSILTSLLKSPLMYPVSSGSPYEVTDHQQQTDSHLEELPTLLHCAAKFGLRKLATLLLQCPAALQACRITNKYGENPACIAEKHGHKEIQEVIKELSQPGKKPYGISNYTRDCRRNITLEKVTTAGYGEAQLQINEDNNRRDGQEEEAEAEDDTYMIMMRSESHNRLLSGPSTGKPPGTCWKIQEEAAREEEAEKKEEEEKRVVKKVAKEEKHTLEGNPYDLNDTAERLYAMMAKEVPEERPPLPPRTQPTPTRQNELFYLSPAWEIVEDKKESRDTHQDQKEDEESETAEEEDPYTSALVDDGLYDLILANANNERRKEGRSFIMNRPPAPAPRPSSVPIKEESTPYIAQVFQQKVTKMHAGDEKQSYAVRNPGRVDGERTTYTTVKPSIPLGQEELVQLQEQVKRGTMSVDEALEKFKQWQKIRSGLEVTQQEKIRQLRDSIIRKRPEEESI